MKIENKADGFTNQFLFVLPDDFRAVYQNDPLFSHLCITDIGFFPNAQYHFRQRNEGAKSAILLICIHGEGCYTLSEKESNILQAGQVIMIPPDMPHEYAASENSPWSIYWLHIQGSLIDPYYETINEQLPLTLDEHQIEDVTKLFHDCFQILKRPMQKEEYFALCQIGSNILGAILLAGKQTGYPLTSKGRLAIQNALSYMKENIKNNITLTDIAVAANFSMSHLNKLFKKSTGSAPLEYFLHMKIHAASKDLYFFDRLVKDIAIEYGIQDPYYFSRIFKKMIGISPQKYRNLKKSDY